MSTDAMSRNNDGLTGARVAARICGSAVLAFAAGVVGWGSAGAAVAAPAVSTAPAALICPPLAVPGVAAPADRTSPADRMPPADRTAAAVQLTDVSPVQVGAANWRVYGRGADSRVWCSRGESQWAPLDGTAGSGPSATVVVSLGGDNGSGVDLLAVRGPNDDLLIATNDTAGPIAWTSIGGYLTSAPSIDRDQTSGSTYVAVRGGDGAIWLRTKPANAGWTGWRSLGGKATSAPSITTTPNGIPTVAIRGTDGMIWQRSISSTQGWRNQRIATSSAPAIKWAQVRVGWVFAIAWRDSGNHLVVRSGDNTIHPGGYLTSAPTLDIMEAQGTAMAIYARGGDNAVWRCHFDTGTWESMGGVVF